MEKFDNIENVNQKLIYPLKYLKYPHLEVSDVQCEKISHGMSINFEIDDGTVVLTYQKKLIAIGYAEQNIIKCTKVFI